MYSIKYRPHSLGEIILSDTIKKGIQKRFDNNDIPQVYLMQGNSGMGKTTLAFIIANMLNCKDIKKDAKGFSMPCGECFVCTDIKKEIFKRDVWFFDASSMGKDDINVLKDNVNTMPMYDKNKVIIIDEVQELSTAAKNSLLKMIEQPKENIYFILCTMDKNKIHTSLKNRSQNISFNNVDIEDVIEYYINILKKENLYDTVPEEFLNSIVTIASNYSDNIRGGLQLIEKCINDGIYNEKDIETNLYLYSENTIFTLIFSLLDKDKKVFNKFLDKNFSISNSFFQIYKMLQKGCIYKIYPEGASKWYLELSKHKNIYDLYKLFSEVFEVCRYDIKDEYLTYKLIDYFNNNTVAKKLPIQENKSEIKYR